MTVAAMTKKATPPAKAPKAPPPTKKPDEPSHKQRFERLLDDAVLGVPPKR